jgi:pimeloyl-ACP methyl ester carboxylesterase
VKVMRARDKPAALRDLNRWLSGNVEMSDDEVELVLLAFQVFRAKLPRPGRLTDDQLRGLAVPVLLLLGEHSRVLDAGKAAKRATDLLPDVTAEITPGATHGLPFEHPEAITARVLDYITRRDTCSQPTSR